MTYTPPNVDEAPYWTPERHELARWFKERVPPFEDGYVAAVELLQMQGFPARVPLICHLVRDIYGQLPRALGDTLKVRKAAEVYPPLVEALRTHWKNSDLGDEPVSAEDDRLVSAQVFGAVRKLMEQSLALEDQATLSLGVRLARALFHSLERPMGSSIPGWVFESFDREYGFFVKRAHLRLKQAPSDEGLLEHFEAFERAFHSMVGPYFRGKGELDVILEDTNRPTN